MHKYFFMFGLMTSFGLFASAGTELADYVAKPDAAYTWRQVSLQSNAECRVHVLQMTSQRWLNENEVDQPLWHHDMAIYVPNDVAHKTAFLMIAGGASNRDYSKLENNHLLKLAVRTKSVTALISLVPNQPLVFMSDKDKKRRSEDVLLAFAWARYLENNNPEWLGWLPMTKSAVRAMDTVSALCSNLPTPLTISSFVLSGKSKRGWTTWLTAAADKRVVAIAPQVIDLLNMKPSMEHHRAAYGEFSRAVAPYVEHGIMDAMNTPQVEASFAVIDPYTYREKLTLPKLIINSSGDEFFLLDSSQFYFDELKGAKYLRYIPNCKHGLDGSEGQTLLSFYSSILNGTPMPEYTWTMTPERQLRVTVQEEPLAVTLWQADNTTARDFRLDVIGKAWTSSPLLLQKGENGELVYETKVTPPEQGWRAFFVELVFKDDAAKTLTLTTEVSVLPNTLPYADRTTTGK